MDEITRSEETGGAESHEAGGSAIRFPATVIYVLKNTDRAHEANVVVINRFGPDRRPGAPRCWIHEATKENSLLSAGGPSAKSTPPQSAIEL